MGTGEMIRGALIIKVICSEDQRCATQRRLCTGSTATHTTMMMKEVTPKKKYVL
jgi:hypothetical protein